MDDLPLNNSQQQDEASGYWYESARPLTSMLFVIPILVCYEAGVLLLGADALRNGADVWLRQFLDTLGFTQYFLLPILTCGLLIAWHYTTRQPWQFRWKVFYGMAVESAIFGLLLLGFAHWQSSTFAAATWAESAKGYLAQISAYCGAGIYEELLFRLILLSVLIGVLRLFRLSKGWQIAGAVAISSIIFSAAHYQFDFEFAGHHFLREVGDVFSWSSFSFRAAAGAFFALLFFYRGFGITAGAHALYDIFTIFF